MRAVLAFVCLLAATGCSESLTGPTVVLGSEFVLAPGQSAVLEGASLTVRFLGITGDSRCPADAVCIQGGSADVLITARSSDADARDYRLRTGDLQPVRHDAFTIALVNVEPYPFRSRTIRPEEYRVTLRVTR